MTDPLSMVAGAAALVAIDGAKEFSKRVAGKLGDEAAIAVSGVVTHRMRNLASTIRKAFTFVQSSGKEAKELPPRLLVPLMEGASLEDDQGLQERWASLLANAAIAEEDDSMPPVYARILANLTPIAAHGLDLLADVRPRRNHMLAAPPGLTPEQFAAVLFPGNGPEVSAENRTARASAIAGLLVREGLVSQTPLLEQDGSITRGEPTTVRLRGYKLNVTDFGFAFLAACSPPPTAIQ